MLSACFREYKYWKLKDLKARLNQPTEYIKWGLGQIEAHLVQTGSRIGTYALSETARRLLTGASLVDMDAPDLVDDDGNVKMENT